MTIVYCTTNLVNGKKYIGSHGGNKSSYLGSGTNLIQAIKKHGSKNFVRQTLWEGPSEFRYEMEEYWIAYFDAVKNQMFYNATEKGVGMATGTKRDNLDWNQLSKKRTQNTDYKNKAEKCKKPILQYDLEGNFIKEWSSNKNVQIELNIHPIKCLRGKSKQMGGYMWRYKTDQYLLNIPPYNNKRSYPKNRKSRNQ